VNAAIWFALLSLLFAGFNDVVFKRYARFERSRGMYVLGMGLVWAVLQAGIIAAQGTGLAIDGQTLAFGVAAGLVLSIANILLIEGMTHIDVGLASTIYRLNSIAVVIMAVTFLAEPLTVIKAVGVLAGVAAVVILFERGGVGADHRASALFFGLVVLAALLRACFGIVSKAAVLRGVDLQLLLLVNAPVWIVVGGLYAFFREGRLRLTWPKTKYSLLSGALICAIANFLMLAVARGEASIVVPIANMSFLVALLVSAGAGMERITPRKAAAAALAIAAIVMLARA